MSKTYISQALRRLVRRRARYFCEYCLMPEAMVLRVHEVDHVIAEKHGGLTEQENLVLCNRSSESSEFKL